MTDRQPELPGQKPGDRRVRVERRHAPYFKYTGHGVLTARAAASTPTTSGGRLWSRAKSILIGRPLASDEEGEERLSKKKALAIFSSDAISSSAYATEEILRVLVVAGTAALFLSFEISIAIAILLAVVSTSYRQIGYAYPAGGGAYAVARANLGRSFALVAAARPARGLHPDRLGLDLVGGRADHLRHPRSCAPRRSSSGSPPSGSSRSATCAACASPATSSPSRRTSSSARPCS